MLGLEFFGRKGKIERDNKGDAANWRKYLLSRSIADLQGGIVWYASMKRHETNLQTNVRRSMELTIKVNETRAIIEAYS